MSGLAALLAAPQGSRDLPLARRTSRTTTSGTPSSTPAGTSPTSTAGTARPRPTSSRGVGEALGFPEHYGQNFDALADCLGDVTAGDSEGWLLLWDGWGPLARHDERAFSVSLSVLGGRVNAERGGPFVVRAARRGPRRRRSAALD